MLQGKTYRQVANDYGVTSESVRKQIKRLREKAARKGRSPEHGIDHGSPAGFHLKNTTLEIDAAGNVTRQWPRYHQDPDLRERLIAESIAALKDRIPRAKMVRRAKSLQTDPDLLNQYLVTDYHLGMYAWGEETGADWDMKIAEQMLASFFEKSIALSPPAHTAVFAQLGDFLHFDSRNPVTPRSGHLLDADTRFTLLVRTSLRLLRRCIEMLLANHDHVHVLFAEGNHDQDSSVWLRETFAAFLADEPRVSIETDPNPFYAYEWGQTSLYYHHGHERTHKKDKKGHVPERSVVQTFVSKFADIYGRTRFRYGHSGHLHHLDVTESNLMQMTQHATLAAPDAHSARSGYHSSRNASVTTYHKQFGKLVEHTIPPEMLEAA
ncbi:MAG: winged helix-turn-helix domain-containing protein [Pseudomonadota bacterium]